MIAKILKQQIEFEYSYNRRTGVMMLVAAATCFSQKHMGWYILKQKENSWWETNKGIIRFIRSQLSDREAESPV